MRSVGVAAMGALLSLSVPAVADVLVKISKSQQRLSVMVDGTEAYRWPVSTGRTGYQTPSGTYHPIRLERDWYSHKYDMAPMPWSVFFYRGYAVHGTTEVRNLGREASHGCVRLRPDNASILYALVRRHGIRHTKLVVMNGPLQQLPQAPRIPRGEPMAEVSPAPAEQKVADVPRPQPRPRQHENLSAKAHAASRPPAPAPRKVARREETRDTAPRLRTRVANVEAYSYSESGNEAQILREREAWLRSIDRKYGITH